MYLVVIIRENLEKNIRKQKIMVKKIIMVNDEKTNPREIFFFCDLKNFILEIFSPRENVSQKDIL